MPREVELFGVLFPSLLLLLLAALLLFLGVDRLLATLGVYRWVWHPSLFRIAAVISLFSGLGLWLYS